MKRSFDFAKITAADFIVRAAYQMGKTPLLPIFAASLGAADAFLGLIVSVSTLTGMLLKPFIGVLSDRWGRRWWLIVGTALFAGMPFLYRFVHSPMELFAIRIVHGLATAIYGPVTLAYVSEYFPKRRAERLGWFGMARNAGYVVGPAVAGWLLLYVDPAAVFTVIGAFSSLAFIPVLMLPEPAERRWHETTPLLVQLRSALTTGSRTPAVWLSGGLEAITYIALYAAKAFLPVYGISAGISVAVIGLFFSVQEAVHTILQPAGGRLGDRFSYFPVISLGMVLMAFALPWIPAAGNNVALLALAVVIGVAQAIVFPSTIALVATQVEQAHLGAGMGLIGTLRNSGKVAGPILAGLLIHWLGYEQMFRFMGLMLLLGAALVWTVAHRGSRKKVYSQGN
jgi:MFS family permease